ncbi:MAG: hypothetical protein K2M19_01535 [Muribaculaceae bacterium]|nr:hypothetical protein [Muribaculaceae bacterium]
MNKSIIGALAGLSLAISPAISAQNSSDSQVILSFHTNIYDNVGEGNAFHFELGATEPMYVDVDCGYGLTEMEVKQATIGSAGMTGSTFSGTVSAAGNVTVYGDPSKIDYVMLEGLYMSSVDLSALKNVEVLNVSYNELESLDLSHMHNLIALYADDNPCNKKPMIIGAEKPYLGIMSISMVENLDPAFDLRDYPALESFVAYNTPTLLSGDTSNCPRLKQFSIDGAAVDHVDFTNNPELIIINVSDTKVTSVDLSPCPKLTEFYATHDGSVNNEYKLKNIDLTKTPNLTRLFLSGNLLEDIDLSQNDVLTDLYLSNNHLTSIDLSNQKKLINLNLSRNYMWYSKLPMPVYHDYTYYQNDIPVERSYKVGSTIDFSDKVLREGTVTSVQLYSIKSTDPRQKTPVDQQAYTYADGKLTLNQVFTDSLVAEFSNNVFDLYNMTTSRFMVKSEADFGQPSATASLRFASSESDLSFCIGIAGATTDAPKTFYIDFGNGVKTPFEALSDQPTDEPNVKGKRAGTITIYTAEGDQLTSISVKGQRLLNVDLKEARALNTLILSECQLPSIVLQYNSRLQKLDLSGNKLTTISLRGVNELFTKNILTDINLANNALTSFDYDNAGEWRKFNVANNRLTEFPYLKINLLEELNISGNNISVFSFRDCESLRVFKAAGNHLSEFELPDYVPLEEVDISLNDYTFANMPAASSFEKYTYAPQNVVTLPMTAPVISLVDYLAAADGTPTVFSWYLAGTDTPVDENIINANNGRFSFKDTSIGKVFCRMSNPAFPDFKDAARITTTDVQPTEKPDYVWGSFKTLLDGIGQMSVTGKKSNTAIYIDWAGNGELEPYILSTEVQHFEVPVTAGAEVKCYSLTEDDGLSGISLAVGPLSSFDMSSLKDLSYFSLMFSKAGNDNIKLPESPALKEMRLTGCGLTDLQPVIEKYAQLKMLDAGDNDIKKIDISSLKRLEAFYAYRSGLEEFVSNNPKLWNLELTGNNLSQLDLSKLPVLDQLFIANNKFETIDLSVAPSLRVVHLESNYFTFTTLPADRNYDIYGYSGQAPLEVEAVDGCVDLSSQLKVGDTFTTYTWFDGEPYLDAELNLVGTPLATDSYEIKDGVTTFLKDAFGVVCVMQNAVFPNLYLTTKIMDVISKGVADVSVETVAGARVNGQNIIVTAAEGVAVTVTDLSGRTVGSATGCATFGPLTSGVYVVKAGDLTFKLLVK